MLKETTMFQVTERADKMIREFQKDKEEIPSIRLKLFRGGWGSKESLLMTLDEPHEDDETFHAKGLTFLINKQLFEQVKPVKIDFIKTLSGEGFLISHTRSAANQSETTCDSTESGSCTWATRAIELDRLWDT